MLGKGDVDDTAVPVAAQAVHQPRRFQAIDEAGDGRDNRDGAAGNLQDGKWLPSPRECKRCCEESANSQTAMKWICVDHQHDAGRLPVRPIERCFSTALSCGRRGVAQEARFTYQLYDDARWIAGDIKGRGEIRDQQAASVPDLDVGGDFRGAYVNGVTARPGSPLYAVPHSFIHFEEVFGNLPGVTTFRFLRLLW